MPRKQYTYHFIYKTTCAITGRFYVGMHSTFNLDDGYQGSGIFLRRSVKKYGKDNHFVQILEFASSRKELILRESEIVDEFLLQDDLCMNLRKGGGVEEYKNHDEETRKRISESVSKLQTGRKLSEYHCKRISESKIGKKRPDLKDSAFTMKDKHHSDDAKKKIGEASKNRERTKATGDLISKSKKGKTMGKDNAQFGTVWIHNDECNKKIKKEQLEIYLNNGWIRGSKRKFFKSDRKY